jgi:hypothetical protein
MLMLGITALADDLHAFAIVATGVLAVVVNAVAASRVVTDASLVVRSPSTQDVPLAACLAFATQGLSSLWHHKHQRPGRWTHEFE